MFFMLTLQDQSYNNCSELIRCALTGCEP